MKLTKSQVNAKEHPEAEFLLQNYKIIHILNWGYLPKIIRNVLKSKKKSKMKVRMKNRSNRYDIDTPRSRYGHKYNTYKKCLTIMMMLICIKQHLSNIWSSIYEKLTNTKAELKKKSCLQKKQRVFDFYENEYFKNTAKVRSPYGKVFWNKACLILPRNLAR